jgi:iron complex outermembrane receptor protein
MHPEPRHVVTFDGIIEEEEVGQVALELSYVGRQALEDEPYRTVSRPYVCSARGRDEL